MGLLLASRRIVVGGGIGIPYILYDQFEDSDGVLLPDHTMDTGSGWTAYTNNVQIHDNQAHGTVNNNDCLVAAEAGQADVTVQASILYTSPSSRRIGLVGRLSDANNYWRVWISTGGAGLSIQGIQGGALNFQKNAGPAHPAVDGQTYVLSVTFSGTTISATFDGETLEYTGQAFNQTETKVGLYDVAENQAFPANWNRYNYFLCYRGDGVAPASSSAPLVIGQPSNYEIAQI